MQKSGEYKPANTLYKDPASSQDGNSRRSYFDEKPFVDDPSHIKNARHEVSRVYGQTDGSVEDKINPDVAAFHKPKYLEKALPSEVATLREIGKGIADLRSSKVGGAR